MRKLIIGILLFPAIGYSQIVGQGLTTFRVPKCIQADSSLRVTGTIKMVDGNQSTGYVLTSDATGVASWQVSQSNTLFDHYADANNSGTSETDLYSDNTAASTLGTNGNKISAHYAGTLNGAVSSSQDIKVYFGGTVIFDSGALNIGVASPNWDCEVLIIRESSSIVRATVSFTSSSAALSSDAIYTRVTGLTLSGTNIMKITGTVSGIGGASNQITASMGTVKFEK